MFLVLDSALVVILPIPNFLRRVARQWLAKKINLPRYSEESGSTVVGEESCDSDYLPGLGPDRCAGCSAESPDCDIEPCFEDVNKKQDLFG